MALGPARLLTSVYEDEDGIRFARARGFRQEREQQEAVLDPRTVTELPAADVDLRPITDVDPHLVHEVDLEATRDMPSTETIDAMPYEEWEQHTIQHPLFTAKRPFPRWSTASPPPYGRCAAWNTESGRSLNMFKRRTAPTAGARLGLAMKLGSIHWAACSWHRDDGDGEQAT